MAKSFLDQLLDLAGLKLPDAKGHYNDSVYRDESVADEHINRQQSEADIHQKKKTKSSKQAPTELTGVAKYLARKYPDKQIEEAHPNTGDTTGMTRVERYLAKKQQEEQERVKAEAAVLENLTGVARYLARLETNNKTAPNETSSVIKTNTASSTRVEEYLARKKQTAPSAQQPKTLEEPPKQTTLISETKVKEETTVTEEKKKSPPKQSAPTTKTSSKLINLAENATQCQAATAKGSQCRRKTNLDTIGKTISGKAYKFSVCSQHNNKDFTPFSKLLDDD